jgi:hypothetical protein
VTWLAWCFSKKDRHTHFANLPGLPAAVTAFWLFLELPPTWLHGLHLMAWRHLLVLILLYVEGTLVDFCTTMNSASDRKKIPISRARPDLTGGVGGEVSEKTRSFSIQKKKKIIVNHFFCTSWSLRNIHWFYIKHWNDWHKYPDVRRTYPESISYQSIHCWIK